MILTKCLSIILFFGFLFCLPLITKAADVPDPTEQIKPLINELRAIIKEAIAEDKVDIALSQRLVEVSRKHFDYHEMSKRVLGKSWRNLSEQEQDDFVELFTQLLQHAHVSKLKDYSGAPMEFTSQRIRGNRAEVRAEITESGRTFRISYIMMLKEERWMVFDIAIEGVSLIRTYMEQFRQIVREESVEVLKERIYAQIQKLEEDKTQKNKN